MKTGQDSENRAAAAKNSNITLSGNYASSEKFLAVGLWGIFTTEMTDFPILSCVLTGKILSNFSL